MAHTTPTASTPSDTLLTIPEAVEALRISRTTFFRLKRNNTISTLRLGSRTLVPQREITRLIDEALGLNNSPSLSSAQTTRELDACDFGFESGPADAAL